jgi:hypothetical protein
MPIPIPQWAIGQLIGAVVGFLLGLVVQGIAPDGFKNKIIYYGSRLRKYVKNNTYEIKVATKYHPDSEIELNQVVDDISTKFNEQPTTHNNFKFDEYTSSGSVSVEMSVEGDVTVGPTGDVSTDGNTCDSILVEYNVTPSYRNLSSSLIDVQDIEQSHIEKIASMGFSRYDSTVVCKVSIKPTLEKLVGDGPIKSLKATSQAGAEVDISQNRMTITAGDTSNVMTVLKRAIIQFA